MAAVEAQMRPKKQSFLRQARIYGFELFMATFGLFSLGILADITISWFFSGIAHDTAERVASNNEESLLLLGVVILVWAPIALFFYLRARGYSNTHAEVRQKTVHKVLSSIYYFANIITIVCALLLALYSMGSTLLGFADTDENLWLTAVVPALAIVLWHGYLLFAFLETPFSKRKMVACCIAGIAVIFYVALLILLVPGVRAANLDDKREEDIATINKAIGRYAIKERSLPASLEVITIDTDKLNNPLSEYEYKTQAAAKYTLCSEFLTDTIDGTRYDDNSDIYKTYLSEYYHEDGKYCYNLRQNTVNYDYDGLIVY